MKHFLMMMGACLLLMGCELHSSDNGDLDGFWQLCQVESMATGEVTDMRESQQNWSVQGDLLVVRYKYSTNVPEVIFRFRHEGNLLTIYDPYISNRDEGDVKIEDETLLYELNIYHLEEKYVVLELDGDRMTLESEDVRLYFRRY